MNASSSNSGEKRNHAGEAAEATEAGDEGRRVAAASAAEDEAGEGLRLRTGCRPRIHSAAQGVQGRRRGPLQDPPGTPVSEAKGK